MMLGQVLNSAISDGNDNNGVTDEEKEKVV